MTEACVLLPSTGEELMHCATLGEGSLDALKLQSAGFKSIHSVCHAPVFPESHSC